MTRLYSPHPIGVMSAGFDVSSKQRVLYLRSSNNLLETHSLHANEPQLTYAIIGHDTPHTSTSDRHGQWLWLILDSRAWYTYRVFLRVGSVFRRVFFRRKPNLKPAQQTSIVVFFVFFRETISFERWRVSGVFERLILRRLASPFLGTAERQISPRRFAVLYYIVDTVSSSHSSATGAQEQGAP